MASTAARPLLVPGQRPGHGLSSRSVRRCVKHHQSVRSQAEKISSRLPRKLPRIHIKQRV
eukprot:560468-Pleurochrysis_carterae.AAC.1